MAKKKYRKKKLIKNKIKWLIFIKTTKFKKKENKKIKNSYYFLLPE